MPQGDVWHEKNIKNFTSERCGLFLPLAVSLNTLNTKKLFLLLGLSVPKKATVVAYYTYG